MSDTYVELDECSEELHEVMKNTPANQLAMTGKLPQQEEQEASD